MISELRTEFLEGMCHGLSLHGVPAATLLGELVAPLDRSALFALETLISSSFRPSSSSVVG